MSVAASIAGRTAKLRGFERQKGDVRHTSAQLDLARRKLGYAPKVGLEQGLADEWNWLYKIGE
ncbi:hypothetical protein D3C83_199790 [compost metagenome]